MRKKNGKNAKVGPAAAAAHPARGSVRVSDAVELKREAFEHFKEAMRIHSRLSDQLDEERVKHLTALLNRADFTEMHTGLLLKAYDFNDADTMHVLLRANQFSAERLSVLHVLRFLSPALYSCEGLKDRHPDEMKVTIQVCLKLKERLRSMFTEVKPESLLQNPVFQVTDLQDEYAANWLLAVAEEAGQALEFYRHRQHLFTHACHVGFTELMLFCLQQKVLPDVKQIPLVTLKGHSPLACFGFGSAVDKVALCRRLKEAWAKGVELNDLCAFELLALCCVLEGVEEIKAALKAHLVGKDINAIARQVVVGEQIVAVLKQEAEVLKSLRHDDFYVIIANTQSVSLFAHLVQNSLHEPFDSDACLQEIMKRFDRMRLINEFRQDAMLKRYVIFLSNILADIKTIDTKALEFIVSLFIREDNAVGLKNIAEQFPKAFGPLLGRTFSEDRSFDGFKFKGFTVLGAALRNTSRQAAIFLYRYILENNLNLDDQALGIFASELLSAVLSEKEPDPALITQCLKDFPMVYCNIGLLDDLLKYCFPQNAVNQALLQQVLSVFMHHFKHPFFNLYRQSSLRFSLDQLEAFEVALGRLAGQYAVEDRQRSVVEVIQANVKDARYLQALLQDPLKDLVLSIDKKNVSEVSCQDYFLIFGKKTQEEKRVLADLLLRHILHLYKTDPKKLADELMQVSICELESDEPEAAGIQDIRYTCFALLCHYELYYLAELCLLLCPTLDFSEPEKMEQYARPLSLLCRQGNIALARQLMSYIVTHTGQLAQIPLYLELCEKRGSPVYVATQVDIAVGSKGFDKQVKEMLLTDYTHLNDEARLQFIVYVNYIITQDSSFTGKLGKFIKTLHEGMTKSMLETAIESQDSLLVLAALKFQSDLKSEVPAGQRETLLKVLFLSPNVELFNELRVQANDLLKPRDYTEQGYSQPMDGLSVCLAQLEFALSRVSKSLVASYCRMLTLVFQTVELPNYYLVTFLSILSRFDSIVFSDVDHGNLLGYCRQVLISKSAQLVTLSLKQDLLDFLNKAMTGVGVEGQAVRKFLVRSDRTLAYQQALTALQYSILSDEQLGLSCVPACHERIHKLREHYPELDFLMQKDYRAVAVMIEDQGSLSENLSVLELCYVLVRAQFLPKAQELVEAALRKRVLSHPDGMNVTQDSLSPMSLLIQDNQKNLVDFLLDQPGLDLRIAAGELPYLAQMCDRLFPAELLEKCCRRIPKDRPLALFVTVSSSVGHSPLYRLYQMTTRKDCVDFLIKAFDAKQEHSEKSAIELLVLVRGWLADSDLKQHYKKLKSIEKSILNFMGSKQINYITSFRKHELAPSQILCGLKTSQEELDSQIVGYDLTMLINAALSSINLPLFRAVCVFMDRRKFLINMTQEHVWMDTQVSSTVLDKFSCLLKNGQGIDDVFAMLKAVLDRADRKDAAIQESMRGLVAVSAGRLHEVFKYSVSYYEKLYPDDFTLFAEQVSALLFQVVGLDDAVLKKLFRILDSTLMDQLLDLLEPLEPYVLEFIRDQSKSSVKRISQLAEKIHQHKSSQQPGIFKESLHLSARAHRGAVGQICRVSSERFEEFALPEAVETCDQVIAEIQEVLAFLENLQKEAKRLEWYLSDDEAVYEAEHHMINTVKELLSRQQKNVFEQKEVLIEAEEERITQERIAAEERAKALAEQARQAALQAQIEAERKAALEQARERELAERARQVQLDAEKIARREHIRSVLVEPLKTLYQIVEKLHFDARMNLSELAEFEQQVSAYRERYKALFDITGIEDQNRFNVNKSLDSCKIVLQNIDHTLGTLERALGQRQRDLRAAEEYQARQAEQERRLKLEAEEREQQRQAAERVAEEQRILEQQAAEEREKQRQAAERAAEEQRRLAEQAAAQARMAAEAERRRQAEIQHYLAWQQEEAFYLTHTHAVTAVLRAKYLEKLKKCSANPHSFHARALSPDAIVAIVPRANLIQDEIGLKVVFEDPAVCVSVEPDCDLYVLDPSIKEGRCCLYFSNEAQGISWTVLQGLQVFPSCTVKPRYPAGLALKSYGQVVPGPFVPGIELARPAAALGRNPSP